jgi:uncharacterized OB-fold protein
MSPVTAGPACPSCGAVLASDQEYCLDCGARRETLDLRAHAVLIAIAGVALVALVVILADVVS